MKLDTYLRKHFKVSVDLEPVPGTSSVDTQIWIEELTGDWTEGLGYFLKLEDCDTYQWHNICTSVPTGKAFLGEAAVKAAVKAGMFH